MDKNETTPRAPMSVALHTLISPFLASWWPVLAYLIGVALVTLAVGTITDWAPRNASGWPYP